MQDELAAVLAAPVCRVRPLHRHMSVTIDETLAKNRVTECCATKPKDEEVGRVEADNFLLFGAAALPSQFLSVAATKSSVDITPREAAGKLLRRLYATESSLVWKYQI